MTRAQRVSMALLLGLGVYAILKRDLIDGDDLLFFAVLFPSIILHEVSHGAAAKAFGDDTAEQAGRLTLNPLAHIDPWGSILLPALLILTTGAAFGYAKPVPVNPRKMRSPRNQGMLTALAGPATNITLCVLAAAVIRFGNLHVGDGLLKPVFTFGYVNVILAAFNLIPLPPLDGSAVVERLLPRSLWPGYLRLRQYSMGLVLLLVFVFPLNRVFDPAYNLWTKLL